MKFAGFDYVAKDIKPLKKKYKGLEKNISEHARIFGEKIQDNPSFFTDLFNLPYCDHICSASLGEVRLYVYKHRCGIPSQKIGPSEGLRIVFGTTEKLDIYIPILIFMSNQEQESYRAPDGKNYKLQKNGIKKIVVAKLNHLP